MISENKFDNSTALAENLANTIAKQLQQSVDTSGTASLAVSGGSTPKLFFECLSRKAIDWQNVTITLVDERWLPPSHKDANAHLIAHYLLKNNAAKATLIPLYNGSSNAFKATPQMIEQLSALHLPLTCTVLGMGLDAHTASFFPDSPELKDALTTPELCLATTPTNANYDRMTLSLQTLIQSRNLYLHIEKAEKLQVLNKAIAKGDGLVAPIFAVLSQCRNKPQLYYCP